MTDQRSVIAGGGAARHLVFVATAADAPPPVTGTTIVVLDTTWTPTSADRGDLRSIRRAASPILERRDLFDEALTRLDAWADATGMTDAMTVDGVAYWFRVRESMWNWLHERMLWRAAVGELLAGAPLGRIVAPTSEPALNDVAAALGSDAATLGSDAAALASPATKTANTAPSRASRAPSAPARIGRLRWWAGWWTRRRIRTDAEQRNATLDRRVRSLGESGRGRIMVVSHMGIRQRIGSSGVERPVDPNLGSVIERLRAAGDEPIVIGLGLDHRSDADWPSILADGSLLPQSVLPRWDSTPGDPKAVVDGMIRAIDSALPVPLDLDEANLAPALLEELRSFARTGLPIAVRQIPRLERMLAELRPRAILLTHEGIRTPWLVAARRAGIPTFAVQHGVLYPTHPGYAHPRHPGLFLPTHTFVFGPYERDVLLTVGGYREAEVSVSGSPRLDLDAVTEQDPAARAAERSALRTRLGVRDGDRMLVISTVNLPFVQRFHVAQMLERLLGGPLPGIHVVFKLHPGETDEGPYRALITGFARAAGHAPPPMTIVRDIDLYALLRAADAHLGLRSTVLTDAVVAGAPNLIALVQQHADMLGYVEAGVARPVRSAAELIEAVADPRPASPAARAAFLERHFRAGDAGSRIADAVRRAPTDTVTVRPAAADDEDLLLAWANEPATRAAGFDPEPIPADVHHRWFARRLEAPESSRIWIGLRGGRPVGVVRVERSDDGVLVVSISVDAAERGRGIARPLLTAGLAEARAAFPGRRFRAWIRPDNVASLALFGGAGFEPAVVLAAARPPKADDAVVLERD